MAVCYSGDPGRRREALAPIRALGEPVFDLLAEQPYTAVQSLLDDTEPKGDHYYWKTEFLAELSDELLATLRDLAASARSRGRDRDPAPGRGAQRARRGRRRRRQPRRALRVRRDGHVGAGRPRRRRVPGLDPDAWERFRPFSTGGNYVNFQTADEGEERVRATYGANYDRWSR